MAGGLGRLAADGSAALCLEPPRLRNAPRYVVVLAFFLAALAAAVISLFMLWPPLATVPYLLVLLVVGQGTWGVRGHGMVRRKLRAARTSGAWLVCNFAGDPQRRGAGRPLLEAVCAEADRRGWVLYLDTVVPRLVEYYAEVGFEEVLAVPARYAGEDLTVWRMVRPPS
jgi:GNAT superfamily N-acetyltransferase